MYVGSQSAAQQSSERKVSLPATKENWKMLPGYCQNNPRLLDLKLSNC